MFLGTRRIQFLQQKKLCSLSKNDRENFFKKFYSNYIYRDIKCSFFNPAEKSLPDERFSSCQSPQKIENLNKILEKFFIEVFLRTRGLHYWQPYWKKWPFAKSFSLSVRRRKKKFKTFFRKTYLSNCSCKHVEISSGSPASIFLTKGRKFFTQCPEMIKNCDSFFCQTCWKNFDWMPKSICLVCENYKTYLIFSQKNFFPYDPVDTSKAVFTTLPKSFRQRAESLSLTCENG